MRKLILSLVVIIFFTFIWNRVTTINQNEFKGTYIGDHENISIDLRVSKNVMEVEWYLDIKDINVREDIDRDDLEMDLILQSGKTLSLIDDDTINLFFGNRGISNVEVDSMPSEVNITYHGHEVLIKLSHTTSNR